MSWQRQEPALVTALKKLQELRLRIAKLTLVKETQRTLATLRALQPPKDK